MTRPRVTLYDLSDPGRPERVRFLFALWSAPNLNGCTVWMRNRSGGGYGSVYIGGRGKGGVSMYAHRAALELKLGRSILSKMEAIHSCDYPPCIDPEHLREGTHHDNMQDRTDRGRNRGMEVAHEVLRLHPELRNPNPARGEASGRAKLTEDGVRAIRTRYAAGETLRHLAVEFGVGFAAIRRIVHRLTWKHLEGPPPPPAISRRRLTDEGVREIRSRSAAGEGGSSIARSIGVAPCTVSQVIHRKTWRHVDP